MSSASAPKTTKTKAGPPPTKPGPSPENYQPCCGSIIKDKFLRNIVYEPQIFMIGYDF